MLRLQLNVQWMFLHICHNYMLEVLSVPHRFYMCISTFLNVTVKRVSPVPRLVGDAHPQPLHDSFMRPCCCLVIKVFLHLLKSIKRLALSGIKLWI